MADSKIKEARQSARLPQKEVAKCLGVSVSTLNQWESGLKKPKVGEDKIVHKIRILDHLTAEGRDALVAGEMTWNEADASYKFQTVKRLSKWGAYNDVFSALWGRIPEEVEETCSVEALTELIDSIKAAYDDGVEIREEEKR